MEAAVMKPVSSNAHIILLVIVMNLVNKVVECRYMKCLNHTVEDRKIYTRATWAHLYYLSCDYY